MSTYRLLIGDCRETLRTLPDASVQCCVTSPPYWGLRDYGHDGQLGLEPTPEEYVANMVEVFREVRRVLRPDGTLWLNLGDSYAAQRGGTHQPAETLAGAKGGRTEDGQRVNRGRHDGYNPTRNAHAIGLKHKDLVGIPWRVAFALQADGWYLRSDIIWAKPNPMPESVTDRPTKAHEYVFLLAKSERYYYDADAIAEPAAAESAARYAYAFGGGKNEHLLASGQGRTRLTGNRTPKTRDGSKRLAEGSIKRTGGLLTGGTERSTLGVSAEMTRNARSVWTIATQPFRGAHFAVFPPELAERCILAGTSQKGACADCGAPWVRQTERLDTGYDGSRYGERAVAASGGAKSGGTARSTLGSSNGKLTGKTETTGWAPSCSCNADVVPCVVLDPFGGSGTTGMVATGHGRRAILCELKPAYADLIRERCGPMLESA